MKVTAHRSILHIQPGVTDALSAEHRVEEVVTEYPITIYVNEQEFATLVCTPEYLEDLVIGFLASEGIIRRYAQIRSLLIHEEKGFAHVEADGVRIQTQSMHSKRYITSCCGKSRQSFYFYNDARTAKTMTTSNVVLAAKDCFRLMRELQDEAHTFRKTGGVHNAALCNREGIVLTRMDIGRHNALDKIYGYCLKNEFALDDKALVFSGRISSEILLKVAKIGCEVVLSKSAPTELALQMADELGITTVGFIRDGSLNVYTHHHRIQVDHSIGTLTT